MRTTAIFLAALAITIISVTQSNAPTAPAPVEWLERPPLPWQNELPNGGLCLASGVPCEELMSLPPKACPAEGDACDFGDGGLVPV